MAWLVFQLIVDCIMLVWSIDSHSKVKVTEKGWKFAYKVMIALWAFCGLIDAIQIAIGGK